MDRAESHAAISNSGSLAGVSDIIESFRRVGLWYRLGWHDFISEYRRSLIGPLWATLIMAIWVAGLGFVFGALLNSTESDFLAYIALGVAFWNYISNMLSSTGVFTRNANLILVVNNPLYTYVLRSIVENLARLGFQLLVFVAVLPFSKIDYSPVMVLVIPGMVLFVLNSLWVVPLMGVLGARFSDFGHIVSSLVRFLFFTTPVFWRADDLKTRAQFATLNPLTHFLEIVRAPLLGQVPPLTSWLVVLAVTACGMVVTLFVYNRFRQQIAYWL
jgi:ABC-type polysaccharide/polyol phosphate export permease